MKPGSKDKKIKILITGEELSELKRFSWEMTGAFGLDGRIERYRKRPIGFYSWDLDCILAVIENALSDPADAPNADRRS